jgi:hypothetical protein
VYEQDDDLTGAFSLVSEPASELTVDPRGAAETERILPKHNWIVDELFMET